MLRLTRQRLDSSPNQSSPSWQEADDRYDKLVAYLNSFLKTHKLIEVAPAPSVQKTPARANGSSFADGGGNAQMISQQRVRIKKLNRDILSAIDTLERGSLKPFQDIGYVAKQQQVVDRFKTSLAKYNAFRNDTDVLAAQESLQKMENMIAFGQNHAAKEMKTLGNVQQRLKNINHQIRRMKVSAAPKPPFETGILSQWLVKLSKLRQEAVTLHAPLPDIKQRAYLPHTRLTVGQGGAYDFQDVNRLERSLLDIVQKIDGSLKTFAANLDLNLVHAKESLSFFDTFNPGDPLHQSKHFLSKGRAEEARSALATNLSLVSEAAAFDKMLGRSSYQDKLRLVERVKSAAAAYDQKYRKALSLARMPKPATTDPALMKIAKQTLSNPKYDYVGDIKRLVVNTQKVHREKETSNVKYDKVDVILSGDVTLSGTETTYHYAWDEFQVATAEPLGVKHYIFYTTLKYFTSGSGLTPLNKWIIGGRIQGIEIPVENIDLN